MQLPSWSDIFQILQIALGILNAVISFLHAIASTVAASNRLAKSDSSDNPPPPSKDGSA